MRIRTSAILTGIVVAFMGCTAAIAMAQGNLRNSASSLATLQNPVESVPLQLGTTVRYGTIMSMTESRMVIGHIHKGKTVQLEFILNSATVRKGEIAVGSQVIVHYRTEHNQNTATSIQVRTLLGQTTR